MSAKSETQLPGFIYNETRIFFGSSLKIFPLEITILVVGELIEKVEEIKKNIRTWGCGASRFGVMALSKGGGAGGLLILHQK